VRLVPRETSWAFAPSLVRRAIDELLRRYPDLDLVSIEWQQYHPCVVVELGQPSGESFEQVPRWAISRFAIWKTTGAPHTMTGQAVYGDPIWTP
jgi:hypothetical protein